MSRDIAMLLDEILPEGWEHNADLFGMSFTLVCPHGHDVEQDGGCHEGCVSPMIENGYI